MKKTIMIMVTAVMATALLCGCNVTVKNGDEPSTGMANPWRDCTEEEANEYLSNGFSAPEGATDVSWSLMLPDNDPENVMKTLVQMRFVLDGINYTAREQAVGDNYEDISGMYYEWQESKDVKLANWAGGQMTGKAFSYSDPEESAKLCTWYDVETGYAYSLSATGGDLSKVDIVKVAESIYDPDKQFGADAPLVPEEAPEEASDAMLTSIAEESAPSIDITGCDTFTQIVDTKLSDGMGYANEKISGEDVLLVSSGTYDNLDGNMAAIDATVFIYKDGKVEEAGKVCCGGTAYPLAIKDDLLYTASNHWVVAYALADGKLKIVKRAAVEYNEKGYEAYYYEAEDDKDFENADQVEAEKRFGAMYGEMEEGKIVNFQPVGGAVSALPPYEYPGPEAFYSVLYKYLTDEFAGYYPDADVTIPCPVIIAEDESNKEDIRVWGDFWVLKYDLVGDVLECTSGGSYPGCMHLRLTDTAEGYEVTKFDLVGDGAQYEPTAKKIFGEHYDALVKSNADTSGREALRAQIIANYVAANDLDITAFKDYGWDPVKLPDENIDNFYSILD